MSQRPDVRRRLAAGAALLTGAGFGIPCVFAIRHFRSTGTVWRLLGLPTYGEGPFDSVGIHTTVPLLAGFLVVCAAEVVDAGLILRDPRRGRTLSFLLLPAEVAYWAGFALPFGPVLGLGRVVMLGRAARA